ncbi:MAG: ATP-dependent sacrificial sulfur transferase LarE [bacterium]|nr:ATP-dependent sacrificial sulfur transferase LarE [bacterium]
MTENQKLIKLKKIILDMKSTLIAYSGGVDSTLLLKVVHDLLGDLVVAITAKSYIQSDSEIKSAIKIASEIGVKHITINVNQLTIPGFSNNPKNRCYICKKDLFSRLSHIAKHKKLNYISDGSNASDLSFNRPGKQAAVEFDVRSPLEEAGLTKNDIRNISKGLNLLNYNKPANSCLVTRLPYEKKITKKALQMVEKAENYIKAFNISQIRVRHFDNLCRIEVPKEEINILFDKKEEIAKKLQEIGYIYITLDFEGYRSGSMDEV